MVEQLPRFTSERTTQIPSMGIVRATGHAALAQSAADSSMWAGVGKMFETVGAYAEQKSREYVAYNTKRAAEEAVIQAGLNPAALKDPVTWADRIYRESAVAAYAIEVQTGIEQSVQQSALRHKNNPKAHEADLEGMLEGVRSSKDIPHELRVGAVKTATALSLQSAFQVRQQHQARVEAEQKAAFEVRRQELTLRAAAGDMGAWTELEAMTMNNPYMLTQEGRAAQSVENQRAIILQSSLNDMVSGKGTPTESINSLLASGISLTPAQMRDMYSIYNARDDEMRSRLAQEDKRQAKAVDDLIIEATQNLYQIGDSDPAFTSQVLNKELPRRLVELGVPAGDINKHINHIKELLGGDRKDDPEIMLAVKQMMFAGNADTPAFVQGAVLAGRLLPDTGMTLIEEHNKKNSGLSNHHLKAVRDDFKRDFAWLADESMNPNLGASLDFDFKERVKDHENRMRMFDESLTQSLNAGKTAEEAANIARASMQNIPKPDKPLIVPIEKAQDRVLSSNVNSMLTHSGWKSRIPPKEMEKLKGNDAFEGEWSLENFQTRLSHLKALRSKNKTWGISEEENNLMVDTLEYWWRR
jgi:hypothetical protein